MEVIAEGVDRQAEFESVFARVAGQFTQAVYDGYPPKAAVALVRDAALRSTRRRPDRPGNYATGPPPDPLPDCSHSHSGTARSQA
ncbi:hypothetical protein GCM10010216_21670 [Streptomyces flaveolus]|nr:hypothetical protein GCM10010216_21670 [Streptomyces flaveolus]